MSLRTFENLTLRDGHAVFESSDPRYQFRRFGIAYEIDTTSFTVEELAEYHLNRLLARRERERIAALPWNRFKRWLRAYFTK